MLRSRCALATLLLLAVHTSTTVGGDRIARTQGSVRQSSPSAARWFHQESANFRVYTMAGDAEAARLVERCEHLRGHLAKVWLGTDELAAWTKRCDVVVFPNLNAYLQVVGREAAQTAGSALIEADGTHVRSRRIDLRGDLGPDMQSALAHELTHVVMADQIDRSRIPAWADEGMAVLADRPQKQSLHLADLREGLRGSQTFRTGELLTLQTYPHPSRIAVFYGQSSSLVGFLVARGEPRQFVQFLEIGLARGYDAGLREVYGINSVAELEQLWRSSLNATDVQFAGTVGSEIWSASIE